MEMFSLVTRAKILRQKAEAFMVNIRFFSNDDVQRHFRMAAFARVCINNSVIDQEEINLYGFNSGFEGRNCGNTTVHKVALSSGISFVKATDNSKSTINSFMVSTIVKQSIILYQSEIDVA